MCGCLPFSLLLFYSTNSGVEYYFGGTPSCSDLSCQDYRSRANAWKQAHYALNFFSEHSIPFWDMANANERVTNDNWLLANSNDNVLVLYLKAGSSGSAAVDLSPSAKDGDLYFVDWFDPRNGGPLQHGTVKLLQAEQAQSLGKAPSNQEEDWVVLLQKCSDCSFGEGSEAGLIAGLVIACILAVAFALLYFHSWHVRKQQSVLIKNHDDEELHLQDEWGDEVPQQVNPELGTIYAVAVATGDTSLPEYQGSPLPDFKDQVRTSGQERKLRQTAKALEEIEQGRHPDFKDQVRTSGQEGKLKQTAKVLEEVEPEVEQGANQSNPTPLEEGEPANEQGTNQSHPTPSFINGFQMEI